MSEDKNIRFETDPEVLNHEWDGIEEFSNPVPKWWLYTWYVCILWALGYFVVMPSVPGITGYYKGLIGYSSRDIVATEIAEAKQLAAPNEAKLAAASLSEIKADADLFDFALAGGRSAYAVNCVQCHGNGAEGGIGYPNLNDDDWLWGGDLESIRYTLAHGIRFEQDEDTRFSSMPMFGKDELLDSAQIADLAQYVLAFSGKNSKPASEEAATVFAENCADCHGMDGKGDQEQGAPNLTDAIWLYGDTPADVATMIHGRRGGVMPAWGHRLDEATIKKLAIYVHSLGGGQ